MAASAAMASCSPGLCPNYAVICSFLERYGGLLDLPELTFPQLERYLQDTSSVPKLLVDLHVKLLRKIGKSVSADRWEKYLVKVCQEFNTTWAWELEQKGYKEMQTECKAAILKYLCECQFDENIKFKTAINEEDPDKMRLQPIGRDKDGQMYWFQLDQDDNVRVYVEEQDDLDGSSWKCIVKDRNDLAEVVALLKTQIDPELLKKEAKPNGEEDKDKAEGDVKNTEDTSDEDNKDFDKAGCPVSPKTENKEKNSDHKSSLNGIIEEEKSSAHPGFGTVIQHIKEEPLEASDSKMATSEPSPQMKCPPVKIERGEDAKKSSIEELQQAVKNGQHSNVPLKKRGMKFSEDFDKNSSIKVQNPPVCQVRESPKTPEQTEKTPNDHVNGEVQPSLEQELQSGSCESLKEQAAEAAACKAGKKNQTRENMMPRTDNEPSSPERVSEGDASQTTSEEKEGPPTSKEDATHPPDKLSNQEEPEDITLAKPVDEEESHGGGETLKDTDESKKNESQQDSEVKSASGEADSSQTRDNETDMKHHPETEQASEISTADRASDKLTGERAEETEVDKAASGKPEEKSEDVDGTPQETPEKKSVSCEDGTSHHGGKIRDSAPEMMEVEAAAGEHNLTQAEDKAEVKSAAEETTSEKKEEPSSGVEKTNVSEEADQGPDMVQKQPKTTEVGHLSSERKNDPEVDKKVESHSKKDADEGKERELSKTDETEEEKHPHKVSENSTEAGEPGPQYVSKEPAEKGAAREQPAEKEAKREEPTEKEAKRGQPAEKEAKREEPTEKEAKREQPAEKEAAREQPAEKEAKREQPAEKEAKREEPTEKEAAGEEPTEKGAAREEPTEKEAKREQPAEKEAAREQPAEKEAKREQPAEKEARREEPTEKEAKREEPTEKEAAREEPTEKEAKREQPAEKEAAREQPAEKEAKREPPAEKEAKREQPAEKEAKGEEPTEKEAKREQPAEKEAKGEEPTEKEAAMEELAEKGPETKEPAEKGLMINEPAEKGPTSKEQAEKEPTSKELAEKEPETEAPAEKETMSQELDTDKPTEEEPPAAKPEVVNGEDTKEKRVRQKIKRPFHRWKAELQREERQADSESDTNTGRSLRRSPRISRPTAKAVEIQDKKMEKSHVALPAEKEKEEDEEEEEEEEDEEAEEVQKTVQKSMREKKTETKSQAKHKGRKRRKVRWTNTRTRRKRKGSEDDDDDNSDEESSEEESEEEDDSDEDYKVERRRKRRHRERRSSDSSTSSDDDLPPNDDPCKHCGLPNHPELILLCDSCDNGYHTACLRPPLMIIPDGEWFCPPCQHKQLCDKLEEQLQNLDAALKKKERAERRKERLIYVGISVENIITPSAEEKEKEEEKEKPEIIKEKKEMKKSRSWGRRSTRAKKSISYRFDEFDEAIEEAIEEDIKEAEGGGAGRGKDMANITGHRGKDMSTILQSEEGKENGRPPQPAAGQRRKKRRRLNDLDSDSTVEEEESEEEFCLSESSEEEFVVSDNNTGAETEVDSNNSDGGSGRHQTSSRPRTLLQRRRSARKRRRPKGYSDDEEEETDEDEEDEIVTEGSSEFSDSDLDMSRRRSRRSQKRAVNYHETSESEGSQAENKRAKMKARRRRDSSDSEASFSDDGSTGRRTKGRTDSSEEDGRQRRRRLALKRRGASEDHDSDDSSDDSSEEDRPVRKRVNRIDSDDDDEEPDERPTERKMDEEPKGTNAAASGQSPVIRPAPSPVPNLDPAKNASAPPAAAAAPNGPVAAEVAAQDDDEDDLLGVTDLVDYVCNSEDL